MTGSTDADGVLPLPPRRCRCAISVSRTTRTFRRYIMALRQIDSLEVLFRENHVFYPFTSATTWMDDPLVFDFRGKKLQWLGQTILSNHDTLFDEKKVTRCDMCNDASADLTRACGHCTKEMCGACGGKVVRHPRTRRGCCSIASSLSPSVSIVAATSLLDTHNKEAHFMRHDETPISPHFCYGWCMRCYMVKPWGGIGAPPPTGDAFICTDCAPLAPERKSCPKCKTVVTRFGGGDDTVWLRLPTSLLLDMRVRRQRGRRHPRSYLYVNKMTSLSVSLSPSPSLSPETKSQGGARVPSIGPGHVFSL